MLASIAARVLALTGMHGTIVESSDCNLTSASVTALSWFVVVDWLMSNGMVEAKDICSQVLEHSQ